MISDVLSDAIAEIERYLSDSLWGYGPPHAPRRQKIEAVVKVMEELRADLDMPCLKCLDGEPCLDHQVPDSAATQ